MQRQRPTAILIGMYPELTGCDNYLVNDPTPPEGEKAYAGMCVNANKECYRCLSENCAGSRMAMIKWAEGVVRDSYCRGVPLMRCPK